MKIRMDIHREDHVGTPDSGIYNLPAVPRRGDVVEFNRFGRLTVTSIVWTPEDVESQVVVVNLAL